MSVTKIWLLLSFLYHLPRKRMEKSAFDNERDQSLASTRMIMLFTYKMHGEICL